MRRKSMRWTFSFTLWVHKLVKKIRLFRLPVHLLMQSKNSKKFLTYSVQWSTLVKRRRLISMTQSPTPPHPMNIRWPKELVLFSVIGLLGMASVYIGTDHFTMNTHLSLLVTLTWLRIIIIYFLAFLPSFLPSQPVLPQLLDLRTYWPSDWQYVLDIYMKITKP